MLPVSSLPSKPVSPCAYTFSALLFHFEGFEQHSRYIQRYEDGPVLFEMSTLSTQERLSKLKQLQKKKAEGAKQNRQELFKEHKQQQIGENRLRSMDKRQEKALDELEKIETEEKGESYERKKGWDYTMEDHEKWDEKVALKEGNKGNAGFSNYVQLAEQSYKKDMAELQVDKEAYKKQKAHRSMKRLSEMGADDEGQTVVKDEEEQDLAHKPSKECVNKLVGTLKGADSRRMKRRKNFDDTDNYINTKNKQFNEKLDRHYNKYQ